MDRQDRQDRHLNLTFQVTCDRQLSQNTKANIVQLKVWRLSFNGPFSYVVNWGELYRQHNMAQSLKSLQQSINESTSLG